MHSFILGISSQGIANYGIPALWDPYRNLQE